MRTIEELKQVYNDLDPNQKEMLLAGLFHVSIKLARDEYAELFRIAKSREEFE